MEFPHLGDTKFPHLSNVNVYSYKNDFDYTRWKVNTRVKLTNVLWNSDYNDVVKFNSDAARDAWFDEMQDTFEIKLTVAQSLPPEGGIKLPIPFDVAARYNYLVVDIPVMTSEDNPIEYEGVELGMRRWFFFVNEVSSRAPNTTMFDLSLDVWTQFHNDVEINYMFLERGHAPVAATDVDTYLANPIDNNDYLLTPDVTPSNANIVSSHQFIPFGNGIKYVCFASNVAPSDISRLGTVTHNSAEYGSGNITYSNADARYGYQLVVHGFNGGNGDDYSNLRLPTDPIADGDIANNVYCYAIPATECYGNGTFFNDLMNESPVFMRNIAGCFVVDRDMIVLGTSHTLAGHTVYEITAHSTTKNITLNKSMFGYPERYQRFAKLYTFPYATIELCDNEGETVTVRIENTGSIVANLIPEIAFPYLNMRTFFTGINGTGSSSYQWKKLDGTTLNRTMPNSDWFEFCFDHEIPCYAIYMDGDKAWYVDNFNTRVKIGKRNALVAYHNAVRSANTANANAVDSNNTMVTNANADADTLVTNTTNTINTTRANMDATIATNTELASYANNTSNVITLLGSSKNTSIMEFANYASSTTTAAENESTAAVSRNSANGAMEAAAQTGVAAGALAGTAMAVAGASAAGAAAGTAVAPGIGTLAGAAVGAAVSAGVGLIQAQVSAGVANDNATSVIQANTATVNANNAANRQSTGQTNQYNESVTYDMNAKRTHDNTQNNNLLDANTDRSNANMRSNNNNTAATMRANANRSRNTANANSGYTREVGVLNAKETLENAGHAINADLDDAKFGGAVAIGSYAGNPMADYYATRGIQVKVRTMPKNEVFACGDWFARYGYALDQIWDVNESGLCPMNHFCYWKCRDIWVDDRKSSNNAAQTLITTMFQRGVTIWKNPDEIGKVSVYDN